MKQINNGYEMYLKPKDNIEAYNRWLIAFDALFDKFNELSKTKTIHDKNIIMNLSLYDGVNNKYRITLNMVDNKCYIFNNGISITFNDFNDYLYVSSYVIDKYLKATNYKVYSPTTIDKNSISIVTDYSTLSVTNYLNQSNFPKMKRLFITELTRYYNKLSNTQIIYFYRNKIGNKNANIDLQLEITNAEKQNKSIKRLTK